MLITETIKKSTAAIKLRRNAAENKSKATSYLAALTKLDQTTKSIKKTLTCATEMKTHGIIEKPIMTDAVQKELLDCIDECGNGVSPDTEDQLTLEKVKLLQTKGDAIFSTMRIVWKDAAASYAKGPSGYLSMISGLTSDRKQANDILANINKLITGDPSSNAIVNLVSNVDAAKSITNEFSINPQIESFLKKVSSQQATIADLSPDVIAWLKEKRLMDKLKVRF